MTHFFKRINKAGYYFDFLSRIDSGTLEDFRKYHCSTSQQKEDPNFWPCMNCDGYGKERREEDRDEYEGWKLAPWYKCSQCGGTGCGDPFFVEVFFNKKKAGDLAFVAKEQERMQIFQKALDKLSNEEFASIYSTLVFHRQRVPDNLIEE